ncbi:hypothetical protein B0H16DRAFT_715158 [Mycena metata]|uniref:Uncharacterized protein n=1 Tax=Mycena metata TaxID=1033252 RepID=A0AAD7J5F0_9AGAR|nr:hypothetical protein B0H16DRAFT_715158 [Mycena metata]
MCVHHQTQRHRGILALRTRASATAASSNSFASPPLLLLPLTHSRTKTARTEPKSRRTLVVLLPHFWVDLPAIACLRREGVMAAIPRLVLRTRYPSRAIGGCGRTKWWKEENRNPRVRRAATPALPSLKRTTRGPEPVWGIWRACLAPAPGEERRAERPRTCGSLIMRVLGCQ